MNQQTRWLPLLAAAISFLAATNGQQKCPGGLTCGENAVCEYTYNGVNCACKNGYSGDPKVECTKIKCTREVCEMRNICGSNTNCQVGKDRSTAICSCKKGYKGNPLKACEPECYSDKDCEDHQECVFPGCRDVCHPSPCGRDALCRHRDHQAVCKCPYNRIGDPWVGCSAECKSSSDCPYDRPVCFNDLCIDPCLKNNGQSVCGEHATCTIKGERAVCSCPKGFTGNAFEKCRPILPGDICKMVSCGEKAICSPHKQNDGQLIALCSCPPRHKGNALKRCFPVECDKHEHCPANKNCRGSKCIDPCPGGCGKGANCEVNKKHVVICSCPPGTTGNPFLSCTPREH
ncbi:hypothetical protein C0J52_00854 [Blattella germanica]|nr:hypothetical protein C0J52_00854 [Blattella germanica]